MVIAVAVCDINETQSMLMPPLLDTLLRLTPPLPFPSSFPLSRLRFTMHSLPPSLSPGYSLFPLLSMHLPRVAGQAKRLMGAKFDPARHAAAVKHDIVVPDAIPTSFNSTENWPDCAGVIGHIRDQSDCGCCWALGSTGE